MSERVVDIECRSCKATFTCFDDCDCGYCDGSHYCGGALTQLRVPMESRDILPDDSRGFIKPYPTPRDRYVFPLEYLCDNCLTQIARFVYAGGDLS